MKDLKASLQKPSQGTRPWAIWIWNQSITQTQLNDQFKFFVESGFAGVAIRAGRDLVPAYLSEEFLVLFGHILEQAKEAGLGIRLADDFSFPQNEVFKEPTKRNATIRAQKLVVIHNQILNSGETFDYPIEKDGNTFAFASKSKNDRIDSSDIREIPFTAAKSHYSFKAPTGSTYRIIVLKREYILDPLGNYLMNPFNVESPQVYINSVLEVFNERFPKYIGTVLEGFITELPATLPGDNSIPWDDDLVIKYRSKYKKELLKTLPILFCDADSQSIKVRAHVYSFMIQSMFERTALTLETWAKKYKMSQWVLVPEKSITGSVSCLRDSFIVPQVPLACVGVQNQEGTFENLCAIRTMADQNAVEYKRTTVSVIGRNKTGAAQSLQSLKQEIDLITLAGESIIIIDGFYSAIDHRSQLKTGYAPFWYSVEASRMKQLCEYVGRMQELVVGTHGTRDIAVLSPASSVATDFTPYHNEVVKSTCVQMRETLERIGEAGFEYDVISESRLGSMTLKPTGELIGTDKTRKNGYRALIVPYSRMIDRSAFVQIEKMAVKKSPVIFIDTAPVGNQDDGISAAFTTRVEKLLKGKVPSVLVVDAMEAGIALARLGAPLVNATTHGKRCADIISSQMYAPGHTVFMFHNTSESQEHSVLLEMPPHAHWYLVSAMTGEITELVNVEAIEESVGILMNFVPQQTAVIIGTEKKYVSSLDTDNVELQPAVFEIGARNYRLVLRNQWKFTPKSFNALPLAGWNTRIGISRESGGYSHYYESYFEVKDIPAHAFVVLGNVLSNSQLTNEHSKKMLEISINGNKLEHTPLSAIMGTDPAIALMAAASPYMAQSFIGACNGLLNKGFNRVAVRTVGITDNPPTIVYPMYVAGDFAVEKGSKGWVVGAHSQIAGYDSWTKYGFPHLSGVGEYHQVIEVPSDYTRLVLNISHVSGAVDVLLNGQALGSSLCAPCQFDITDSCDTKRNELVIRVSNTIDNIMRMSGRPAGIIGEVFLDVY